jgi:hypothetical protein
VGYLRELIAVDHRETYHFFLNSLTEVLQERPDTSQLKYSASVLAHYAETSTESQTGFPTAANLSDVLDQFIIRDLGPQEPRSLEEAGAQTLFLTGFFQAQMRRRHSIRWFIELGQGFFSQASDGKNDFPRKQKVLRGMSANFSMWTDVFHMLSIQFQEEADARRDERFLIKPS